MFSHFVAFLGPNIFKLAFCFGVLALHEHKIKCQLFNFGSQKCQKIAEQMFYTYITLWNTMKFGFHHSEIKKRKKLDGVGPADNRPSTD